VLLLPGVGFGRALTGYKWEVAGVFNLVVLAAGGPAWMGRGCREGLLRPTLLGSLLLVRWWPARYFGSV